MANLDLSKYGITDVKEVLHNPSYDVLFAEETKPGLEGFEKGQVTEQGARSEERRVGKECSEPCRSRWSPYH